MKENTTAPALIGFDHMHVYVTDRAASEKWYLDVMGLRRVTAYEDWALDGAPLTISNPTGTIHLALFERAPLKDVMAIAFGVTGAQFLEWKEHLKSKDLAISISDHEMSYSMYFRDLDKNGYEITSYEYDFLKAGLV